MNISSNDMGVVGCRGRRIGQIYDCQTDENSSRGWFRFWVSMTPYFYVIGVIVWGWYAYIRLEFGLAAWSLCMQTGRWTSVHEDCTRRVSTLHPLSEGRGVNKLYTVCTQHGNHLEWMGFDTVTCSHLHSPWTYFSKYDYFKKFE